MDKRHLADYNEYVERSTYSKALIFLFVMLLAPVPAGVFFLPQKRFLCKKDYVPEVSPDVVFLFAGYCLICPDTEK